MREELVRQAGHKSHRSQVRAMLETGQLSGTGFTLKRAGYNEVLVSHLIESLQCSQQLRAATVIADDDVSDDGA